MKNEDEILEDYLKDYLGEQYIYYSNNGIFKRHIKQTLGFKIYLFGIRFNELIHAVIISIKTPFQ